MEEDFAKQCVVRGSQPQEWSIKEITAGSKCVSFTYKNVSAPFIGKKAHFDVYCVENLEM